MEKTTRRNLLRAAAIGTATATGLSAALGAEQKPGQGSEHAHDNRPLTDKRAHVVVSFGQWDVDPAAPHDRQPLVSNRFRNIHRVLSFETEVDAGGAVSFNISGLHQILIYGNGRDFADIHAAWVAAGSPVIPGIPPLVEYATDRVYRGLDPRVLLPVQDRIESVNFKEPGRYLVVCGVVGHFNEGMHGYVNVKA